ncbi:hypothetical protein QMK61_01120 [Fulvimonas sp. R45]|uniref:protein YgfX n=1 Tax=Fulvimonas sp. R45 TaxID=3045937 RepID=UPI002660014F|nr:protein YgfX [Fulvimonas sp. R45]MDO1527421.1 hypothetical protein [Fulvimonas sp. R45]
MTSAPAIGFEYRPSRLLPRLLAAALMLALLAIAGCGLAGWAKLLLAVAALACWLRAILRPGDTGVTAAGWAGDGGWTLRRAGEGDVATILSSSRVLGAFVLLRLRDGERRTATLLLGPDNSDADIRRRLRMRLALAKSA